MGKTVVGCLVHTCFSVFGDKDVAPAVVPVPITAKYLEFFKFYLCIRAYAVSLPVYLVAVAGGKK